MLGTERGRKLVGSLPTDRLLTETDGPFTAEAGRPRRPSDAELAVTRLAAALQVPVEECRASLLANLRALTSGSRAICPAPSKAPARSLLDSLQLAVLP